MNPRWLMPMVVAAAAGCLGILIAVLASGRKTRLDSRLKEMKAEGEPSPSEIARVKPARRSLPKIGTALMPTDEKERTQLQARLIRAGFYGRQAMLAFLGVKMVLMTGPAIVGLVVGLAGIYPLKQGLLYGACVGAFGMIGPSMWLDRKKKARQMVLRRGIPDALDVIVICVEGGLSLVGAIRRVAGNLHAVHPVLSDELELVQREVQLGQTAGEALRRLAERVDMEEIRSLASIIIQSERFGSSLAKALRIHADSVRHKRQQRAEEMAQKAGTKVLFPTLLFIFPAIFVVILGPAMIQIGGTLSKLNN